MNRAPIVALSAVAALFLATAAVFTVLYFGQRSETDRLTTARATEESTAADVAREREEADQSLEEKRSRKSSLDSQQSVLTKCTEATKAYMKLPVGDSPESNRLFQIMYETCPLI
ncbi:hypothetical protein [Saccharothrix variisporea]|uniref:Uncharacterized protein n=1 Tax=Saccharothrix variisporea TaxID=543527 RepID=A0A495XGM6_9PSEU|nr:hypothetical protein [Saccharothrix variisporea]RKT73460.1 hypothetical protein DFJ66_6793 [Saccharothrix variisporea]